MEKQLQKAQKQQNELRDKNIGIKSNKILKRNKWNKEDNTRYEGEA
jgi:hypothetical protein